VNKKIKFYCDNDVVKRNCPVLSASKSIPNWYQQLSTQPKSSSRNPIIRLFEEHDRPSSTIKSYLPVSDYLNSGYIIPWTHQVIFKKVFIHQVSGEETSDIDNAIKSFKFFSSGSNYISWYHPEQMPELNTYFFSVSSDWKIQTPKGYSSLIFQPFYHFEKRYSIFPTVIDTDKFHEVNFVGYMLEDQFTVNPNEPLVCILPFKRDRFDSESVKGNPEKSIFSLYFRNKYRRFNWEKKSFK
jgi:hypothetical protein